ncbi:hypothetical protein BDZ94DRAFT_1309072 [Collybia nuda]|uniref:Uncharacterized protein n=1 Tax=Collybia nuda TaxID=64659 RepID=A0A9P5Y8L8_9AGAR|nr:hypothetical protein BDZ94DRAFT_1309072 [Collybia nuda]
MSCHLLNLYPGVTDCEGIPSEHLGPIKEHIDSKGFKVANIFASYGGPQVTFLLPQDADRFMALQRIIMPAKISKHKATIEPIKETPILRAFELMVVGACDYDRLAELVVKWARKTSPKCFLEVRSDPTHSDLIIFSMSTWTATRKILNSSSLFRSSFPNSISTPCLLWDHNSNPLKKNALGDQVARGASQISSTVAALAWEVGELKSGMAIVQRQQEVLHANQEQVFGMIDSISSRITDTQNAIISQARDQQLRSRLIDLEARHGQIQLTILFTTNPLHSQALQAQLAIISDQVNRARADLEESSNHLSVIMGCPAIPPPPTITAPPPTPILPQPTLSNAGPSPPKRKRTQSPAPNPPAVLDPLGAHHVSTSAPQVALDDDHDKLVSLNPLCLNLLGSLNECQRHLSTAPATNESGHATSPTTNLMGHRDWQIAQRRVHRRGPVHTYSFPAFSHFHTTVTSFPNTPEPCASISTSVPSPPSLAALSCYFLAVLPIRSLLFLLVLLFLVNATSAMPTTPQSSISMCALNANGLVYPVKLALISPGLPITNYEIFEENGVQYAETSHGKWGIVLGVCQDIQVVSRVPLAHASLKGRVAIVDVVIPSIVNSPIHRIFAVYALCNPDLDQLLCEFWPNLTAMVQDTQTLWSILGDLNATVLASERASDNLITKIRHLGGAILRSHGSLLARSHGSLRAYHYCAAKHISLDPPSPLSLTRYLQNIKQQLHRDLYAAKKDEIMRRAREHDCFKMLGALHGGSTKRLMNKSSQFIALPTALESTSSPGIIKTAPAAVTKITRQYFTNLYGHQDPPDKPKPWMTTPSVLKVRSCVERGMI